MYCDNVVCIISIESRAVQGQYSRQHTGETVALGRREGAESRKGSADGVGGERMGRFVCVGG